MSDNVTPQFLVIIFVSGLLLLFGPRKFVLPTFLAVATFVSMEWRILVGDFNFFTIRILLLFSWIRILARGEHKGLQLLPLDKACLLFFSWAVLAETLQRGFPGLIYGISNNIYDALGTYFLFRVFLRESNEVKQVIVCLAWICSALALFMLAENLTGRNWLTPLGAHMQEVQARSGRLRCQATFAHPVLAGTYGAVVLPLFVACWWQDLKMKRLAVLGCIAATIITITAGSGGPVMTYVAVVAALCLWPMRRQMRLLRWGILLSLVSLHIVMKAPVWALIGRMQVVQGASGHHRYVLVDTFIRHLNDWWLIGVQSTEDWGWLMDDVANTYCLVSKHGGLLALILFIRLFVIGFREVGIRRTERMNDRPNEIMIWAFGAWLFGHLVTYFATSYFDQMRALWPFTLAMIASLPVLSFQKENPQNAVLPEPSFTDDRMRPVFEAPA